MPGMVPVLDRGPNTFEVVEAVLGGQLLEYRTGGKVGVAAAGSTTFCGVALKDAIPLTGLAALQVPTATYGQPFFDASVPNEKVTAHDNAWFTVKYAAACAVGKAVKCGALGTVTPWVSGTDAADLIVGYCAEPLGVGAANGNGLTRVNRA